MIRILLAGHDALLQRHLARTLERAGFTTASVGSAAAAMDRLAAERFDLLLVEPGLQSVDGFSLTQRASEAQRGLRVMVVTGFSAVLLEDPRHDPSLFSAPFHLRELVSQLDQMFRLGSAADL